MNKPTSIRKYKKYLKRYLLLDSLQGTPFYTKKEDKVWMELSRATRRFEKNHVNKTFSSQQNKQYHKVKKIFMGSFSQFQMMKRLLD